MQKKLELFAVPIAALCGLAAAGALYLAHSASAASIVLLVTLILGTAPLAWGMLKDIRRAVYSVDVIAITAIGVSFATRELLAGCVVVIMLSGGQALEFYAQARAREELTSLLAKVPTVAHVKGASGTIGDVAAERVAVGDLLVVKPGEIFPVDGVVAAGTSDVDESSLTGEGVPVAKRASSQVFSGTLNGSGALEVRAAKTSSESRYAAIVKMVVAAQESKAPVVRLADRYSIFFTAVTFVLALGAWIASHDAVRLLAVLVVATPCPLILATPIALISGISRAASRGIIVKSGSSLETLGEVKSFIFDKTGTLTFGTPKVVSVETFNGHAERDVVHAGASVDQLSTHVLARALVEYAAGQGSVSLEYPDQFKEFTGDGVTASLGASSYTFGKLAFLEGRGVSIPEPVRTAHAGDQEAGEMAVYLALGKELAGAVHFSDEVRPEAASLFTSIRAAGIRKVVMLTGDRENVAAKVASALGIREYHAECKPEDKVTYVRELQVRGSGFAPVAMVGDGINDAPALAAADVGIALGIHGENASSEAGDIVITVNNANRVAEALSIAQGTLYIAKESIFVGMGLSILLMLIAAFGGIQPVAGALMQEGVDVLVILNALRVLTLKVGAA